MENKKKFRYNAKRVFLTYTKSTFTKEEVLSHLQTYSKTESYVISSEKHQDGTDHIHAVVVFSKKLDTIDPRFFDFKGVHPNIEVPKTKEDLRRVARYVAKDGDFIQDGGLLKKTRDELFQTIIQEGKITAELIHDNPGILALNFNSIKGWLSLLPKPKILSNRRDLPKKRHYWVHGPSNTGKSTWLYGYLKRFRHVVVIPDNNDWAGADVDTEVVYSDEYKGHLTLQALNRLCDGMAKLNTKGSSTFILQPLCIIVSNFSISDCYSNLSVDLLETLYNRFVEYNSSTNLPPL